MTRQRPEPSGDLTAMEIAEAMWLASVVSRRGGALDHPPPGPRPPEETPDSRDSEPTPSTDPDLLTGNGHPRTEPMPPADAAEQPAGPSAFLPRPRPPAHTPAAFPRSDPQSEGRRVGAPPLAAPLALARALRPLRTHTVDSCSTRFDEAATARRAVEDDFWLPVFRPARSRPWHEATLIIDDSPTMSLWHRTGAEFAELLARIDAFGAVRTLRLDTTPSTDGGPPVLRNRTREVSPRSLGTPGRRSVVLVLTDGIGPAWRAGTAQTLLRDLARTHTTAVVQLLPERTWAWTGIQVRPALLHRAAHGPGNAELAPLTRPVDALDGLSLDDEVLGTEAGSDPLVPVLRLHPEFLGRWSRLAAGRRTREPFRLPVMLTSRPDGPRGSAEVQAAVQSARATVRHARSRVSPTAFDGAVRLAALPLSEAVVHRLPPLLDPGFQQEHLGELLASELLRLELDDDAGGGSTRFSIDSDVRAELLSYGNREDTYRSLRLARPLVTDQAQREVLTYQLRSFLGDPVTPPVVTDVNRAYVTLSKAVLRALSGPRVAHEDSDSLRASEEEASTDLAAGPRAELAVHDRSAALGPVSETATALSTDTPPSAVRSRRTTSIWYGLPPRNIHFTGRARELGTLEDRLLPEGPMTTVEALLGMGGIGKTQLAVEHVYRHSSAYDVICWIPSDHPTRIVAAFGEIARLLGLPPSPGAPAHADVPAVLETLRTGELWQRWLLIFDNADAVQDVQPFFPLSGPGRVLVTSRNKQWSHVARAVEVDALPRHDSRELLRRRGEHISHDQAEQLADALGDLPLALDQASAWLLDTGMPAEEYLRLFRSRVSELLTVDTPPGHHVPVAAAWDLALARLREEEPLALRILHVCSQLAPAPVPRGMFVAPGGGDSARDALPSTNPLLLARAIRALNRYSLARIDHRANSIQIHRLLSAVLTHTMTPAERTYARRVAWQLLAIQPPAAHLTDHLIASGAATATEAGIQSAVRAQLDWLESHGFTKDKQRLYREAHGNEDTGTGTCNG
ncbi:FxSxx-COOH system tetratricopeptide repeat protein [Streptomyces sp. NPDC016845]|uniref:FxSxx-COOH system tetratricopeptide repeat protein n=1 Tax=Streptomyces sp. NPDC016845 TaxID=3364972 RepID=UPI0037A144EC